MSSWSSPTMSAPLRLRTPRTRKGTSLTYTSLPTGDSLAEELARHRLAQQADHGDVADVVVGERLALLELLPLADPEVSRRGADEVARDPVLVAVDELAAGEDQGRQAVDARALVEDRVGVLGREGLDAAAAQADAVPRRGAGLHHDVVDPRLGQEHADRRPGPRADLGDRQQRRHPDDDAQRRQRRAQGVAAERAQGRGRRPRQEAEVGAEPRRPASGRCAAGAADGSSAGRGRSSAVGGAADAGRGRLAGIVVVHQAVADPDDAAGVRGHRGVVGHQDDRQAVLAVELPEEGEDLLAGLGVEVAGGLVGDQERAAVDQRPGDRDPLLLAAREPRRLVVEPVAQADPLEQRPGPAAARGAPTARAARRRTASSRSRARSAGAAG